MSTLTFTLVNDTNKLIARQLLAEYGHHLFNELKLMAGNELFFKELDKFPDEKYTWPKGAFFIIIENENAIGCAGLKRFDDTACELKRMYIKPEFQGKGYAKQVVSAMLQAARALNYALVLLDTNREMAAALNAYLKAGFIEIPAYCENENPRAIFMAYYL